MKRIYLIMLLLASGISIFAQKTNNSTRIEVYYFHITNRCPTCLSIEANTKKTLDTYFIKEQKEGTIKLKVLNVDDEKNKAISEKYAAYGSALFITRIVNGKETITDLTNFAFQNSLNRAEKFIEGLKSRLTENLK